MIHEVAYIYVYVLYKRVKKYYVWKKPLNWANEKREKTYKWQTYCDEKSQPACSRHFLLLFDDRPKNSVKLLTAWPAGNSKVTILEDFSLFQTFVFALASVEIICGRYILNDRSRNAIFATKLISWNKRLAISTRTSKNERKVFRLKSSLYTSGDELNSG